MGFKTIYIRAKAHSWRDADARNPNVADTIKASTIETITVAAVVDCVAFLNISMNGYPVGVFSALSTFPIQNRTDIVIAKPRAPFKRIVNIMLRGTLIEASLASSASHWSATWFSI